MLGLLLHLAFFTVAAVGVWVCGRALLEIDRRYAEVDAPDAVSATAPAPVPPPSTEPEPAAPTPEPEPSRVDPLVA
ncbi:MAG: hypothetical protein QOG87_700 [Actinomycetota bacterium]